MFRLSPTGSRRIRRVAASEQTRATGPHPPHRGAGRLPRRRNIARAGEDQQVLDVNLEPTCSRPALMGSARSLWILFSNRHANWMGTLVPTIRDVRDRAGPRCVRRNDRCPGAADAELRIAPVDVHGLGSDGLPGAQLKKPQLKVALQHHRRSILVWDVNAQPERQTTPAYAAGILQFVSAEWPGP